MARFYARIIQPAYFHLVKTARLLLLPLFAAGGLAFVADEVLGLPRAAQIVLWSLGLLIGLSAWIGEYWGDSGQPR